MGPVPGHIGPQGFQFFRGVGGQVQLKAEGARQGRRHPRLSGGDVAVAVVGHGGKVGPHDAAGIEQTGAVLDQQAGPGVGVVAAPDLGAVVQHPAVETGAAACAVFQQQAGEGLGNAALQLVHPQHIPVVYLALTGRGQSRAVHVGQRAVHVPFEVLDGAAAQHPFQLLPDAIHHFLAAEVQGVLLADLKGAAARDHERPVGMGLVQIAVGADRLRLHPQAQLQAHLVQPAAQAGQAVGQFGLVLYPVAQAGRSVVAALEPAVVQHEQVDVGLSGGGGQVQQLRLVKVEVAGLPAVQQHRAGRVHVLPAGRQQPGADGVVEAAAHLPQAVLGVDHGHLRGGEALAGREGPVEVVGVDAHDQPLARVGPLGLDQEVAAVHEGKPPAVAVRLGGVGAAQGDGGVVGVAGHPADAAHTLDAAAQGRALRGALGGPGAVQGDEVQAAGGVVHAQGRRLVQRQGLGTRVFVHRRAGDEVLFFIDRVAQLHFQPKHIPQGDGQGLDVCPAPEGGQAGQGRLAGQDRRARKHQLCRLGAVGIFGHTGRGAVVRRARGRPFFGQQVGPAAGVPVGGPAVGQVGRAVGQAGAVVGVQQHPVGPHRHLIAGVGGVQGVTGFRVYDHVRSSSPSVCSSSKGSRGGSGLRPACSIRATAGRIRAAIPRAVTEPPARNRGSSR